jgi:hypothetical protein
MTTCIVWYGQLSSCCPIPYENIIHTNSEEDREYELKYGAIKTDNSATPDEDDRRREVLLDAFKDLLSSGYSQHFVKNFYITKSTYHMEIFTGKNGSPDLVIDKEYTL